MIRTITLAIVAIQLTCAAATVFGQGESDTIVTDRPDFTEASSTVGRGVVQLETGYTYFYNDDEAGDVLTHSQFYDQLWRIGVSDYVELRLAWIYGWEETKGVDLFDGANDLYLGSKIFITEQNGFVPEMSTIVQGLVPTGARAVTTDRVEVGVNHLYSWTFPGDWSIGGSTGVDTFREEVDSFMLYHQSVTCAVPLTDVLGMYIEYFGLYTYGRAVDVPANFVDGGFTYLVTPNVQLDIRAGLGLNERAEDFFTGSGISVRF